jgi:hypothetical protein
MRALGLFTQTNDKNYSGAPNKLAQAVTVLSYICDMNSSNVGQDAGYPD